MGGIDLDFLSIDHLPVELLDGGLSTILVSHCHEGITFSSDVDIGDFTAPNNNTILKCPQ